MFTKAENILLSELISHYKLYGYKQVSLYMLFATCQLTWTMVLDAQRWSCAEEQKEGRRSGSSLAPSNTLGSG